MISDDSIAIHCISVGQMKANCYLIEDKKRKDCLILDPGDDAEFISQKIIERALKPRAIIATHGHFDHIMGVSELCSNFSLPFYLHKNDMFLVQQMQASSLHFLKVDSGPPPDITGFLSLDDPVHVGDASFSILHTPGHTPGSISLYEEEKKWLFSGDVIFKGGGVGRTDFSYSNHDVLNTSLTSLFMLDGRTLIYPGHGDMTTIKDERLYHSDIHDMVHI